MRTAIYTRYSSDMQNATSCDDQEREARAMCARHGFTVVLVARDEAIKAGASASRLGWQRVIAAAKASEIDLVAVHELSRFSRDLYDGVAEVGVLKKYNVRLVDMRGTPLDPDDLTMQVTMCIGLSFAQAEARKIGERSKRGLKGQTERGFSSGGEPAYGYKRAAKFSDSDRDVDGRPTREGVRFAVDPDTAPVVRDIFEAYANGMSKRAIAVMLNERGIPTKRANRVRLDVINCGKWNTSAVVFILRNEIYRGVRVWNRQSRTGEKDERTGRKRLQRTSESEQLRVEGFAPPIIGHDLWERVQQRLASDAQTYEKRHTARVNERRLLHGLLRCAECTGYFTIGGKRKAGPVYRCSIHNGRGDIACSNHVRVLAPGLEATVKSILVSIVKHPERLKDLVAEHNRRINESNSVQLAQVRLLESRHRDVEAERDRLVTAIAKGTGGAPEVLVREIEAREAALGKLSAQIAEAEAQVAPLLLPRPITLADYLSGSESVFTGDLLHDRQTVEDAVDRIIVYPTGAIALRFRAEGMFGPVHAMRAESMGGLQELAADFDALRSIGGPLVMSAGDGGKGGDVQRRAHDRHTRLQEFTAEVAGLRRARERNVPLVGKDAVPSGGQEREPDDGMAGTAAGAQVSETPKPSMTPRRFELRFQP